MEAVVTGAIAWSEGEWLTVVLAYLEAISWEPALQDLWPRVQVAATHLEGERECEKNDIERLRGLINRVVMTELTDDGMAVLGRVVSILPVDGGMEQQRCDSYKAKHSIEPPEKVRWARGGGHPTPKYTGP